MAIQLTKRQRIDAFLRTNLPGYTDIEYAQMTETLALLWENNVTPNSRGLPTYTFTNNTPTVPKAILERMVKNPLGLLYVRRYKRALFWCERQHTMLFGPDEKDDALMTELRIVVAYALVNPTVKATVVQNVGLGMNATESQILTAFNQMDRMDRVTAYNEITDEIENQQLLNPTFGYMPIFFKRMANRYRPSHSTQGWLPTI